MIVTKSLEARERVRRRLVGSLETEFPCVVGRVYPLEVGPPVGWPLQYRISIRADKLHTGAGLIKAG